MMLCPKCGQNAASVVAVTETKYKRKKGCIYWMFIGWWWEVIAWIYLFGIKLLKLIFGNHYKAKSVTHTEAVCQNCGYRWKVTNSQVRSAASYTAASMDSNYRTIPQPIEGATYQPPAISAPAAPAIPAAPAEPEGYFDYWGWINSIISGTGWRPSQFEHGKQGFWMQRWFKIVGFIFFPLLMIPFTWLVYPWTKQKRIIATVVLCIWAFLLIMWNIGKNIENEAVSASDAPAYTVSDSSVSLTDA